MSEPQLKPPQDEGSPLSALARAVATVAQGLPLDSDARKLLERVRCFPAATSFRVVMPLSGEIASFALVSSDVRGAKGAPVYWAAPEEGSLVGRVLRSGRTASAEGPGALKAADLRQLAGEGAASFLGVPVLIDVPPTGHTPGPTVAALLLAYPSSAAASSDELRQALLLAAQLTRAHGRELGGYVGRLHRALHPAQHEAWGPGFDNEYPELEMQDSPLVASPAFSEDGSGASASASGSRSGSMGQPAAAPGSAVLHPALRCVLSPTTLRFADENTERRFLRWRSSRLARVDAAALLALLVYHLASCLMPPTGACSPATLGSSLPAALTVLAPLLLLLGNRSKRWYRRHRDQLLSCTYLLLACHQALDLPAHLSADQGGLWHALSAHAEWLWCAALGVILQVQFVGQCAMLAGGVALKALVQTACAGRLARLPGSLDPAPNAASHHCMLDGLSRPLLLCVVLPCSLTYYTELSARRTFASRMSARRSTAR
ncbi:digalactosyldiacylglycerol synthase [Micractinium conductrix]|uniref:Digalactosyldiacylglycerol synthase n=1 Tax=Micractinium conductrix TaxID=554055 RepID=A0A2P6V9F4_9CHLO|nr:digalactosyldiacylglycerol synthase [Micractinium conductrix]|eukprot:PSC70723.1 digalactosyldiacylglycerol synthase [Micractinium conductrix]